MNLYTQTHTLKWLEREYWENFPLLPKIRKANLVQADFSHRSFL